MNRVTPPAPADQREGQRGDRYGRSQTDQHDRGVPDLGHVGAVPGRAIPPAVPKRATPTPAPGASPPAVPGRASSVPGAGPRYDLGQERTDPAPGAGPAVDGDGVDQEYRARWWHPVPDGRLRCEVCPRRCTLRDGQRGFCFVRARHGDAIVLTTYGRSSGFVLDPVEKKPLAHVLPGSTVLSFGTAGCNLACRYCQNWEISTSRDVDTLAASASPAALARAAGREGAVGVAFTYNDPVVFAEYAIDVTRACHDVGLLGIAVSAGWIEPAPRRELFGAVDAANIDLKGFTDDFYRRVTGARLADVLDTLVEVRALGTWLEITTLLIPGYNDSDAEIAAECAWVAAELGVEVPVHFSAFHPAHRMLDVARTPPSTLVRARDIAHDAGLAHVYLGNVRLADGATTRCAGCGSLLVDRAGYHVTTYRITPQGTCPQCGRTVPGIWDPAGPPPEVGQWWSRRVEVGP